MDEKISVIIPIYNVESYLDECVQSTLHQTYSNLEIILVDDGSTDSCTRKCDDYAEHEDRVRVLHTSHFGPGSARNRGLEIATGDYICFLDSDDYIEHDMLERLLDAMKYDSSDMAVCCFTYLFEDELFKPDPPVMERKVLTPHGAMAKLYSPEGVYFSVVWNKLYKKSVFTELRFPEGKIFEDTYIAHFIIDNCSRVSTLPDRLYHYRRHSASIMGRQVSIRSLDQVEALCSRYEFIASHSYASDLVAEARKVLAYRYADVMSKLPPGTGADDTRREAVTLSVNKIYRQIRHTCTLKEKLAFTDPKLFTRLMNLKKKWRH